MTEVQNAPAPQKKFIVALLLCIFLGSLGIHRFYLGENKTGFIMLGLSLVGALTFGITSLVAFAWAVYDIVQICMGKLKAADGSELAK